MGDALPRTRGTDADPALGAWSVLWASAILFSILASPGRIRFLVAHPEAPRLMLDIAIATLALWIILRPARILWIVLLAGLQLLQVALLLPDVPNHRLILALVDLALLASIAGLPASGAFDGFAPVARGIVLVVYAFAGFAKLNSDFLDPTSSCALLFYRQIADWWPLPAPGDGIEMLATYGSVVAECLLVITLAWRPLRRVGMALGLAFHFVLALDATQNLINFSAVMFALLPLFSRRELFEGLAERIDRPSRVRPLLVLGFLLVIASGLFAATDWREHAIVYYVARQLVWSTVAVTVAAWAFLWRPPRTDERPRARPPISALAVLVLAILNGLGPYLGWKTRTAFDMYSNLRLEADRSNHLLVPRSLDVLGLLSDRVELIGSNDPWLERLAKNGEGLPWVEVERALDRSPSLWVRYRRGGEERTLDSRLEARPAGRSSRGWRSLVVFRPLGESSRAECLW